MPSTIIKVCVPVDSNTYDVSWQIATVEDRRSRIYRQKFGDETSQKDLSAITHVAEGKTIPPFAILHVADHPETRAQSERLAKALQEAGISAKAVAAAGKNQETINADLRKPEDEPTKILFEFMEEALKRTKQTQ